MMIQPLDDETVRLINSDKKTITLHGQEYPEPLDMNNFVNITEGARTDSLYRIACSLFSKMDKDDAVRVLTGVNQTYAPPLTAKEFEYQVERAFQFVKLGHEKQDGNTIVLRNFADLLLEGIDKLNGTKNGEDGKNQLFHPKEENFFPVLLSELKKDNHKVEWLWKGYLAKGHITLLAALWKAGKTTFLSELFRCMSEKASFAGQETTPCSVLYLSEERETQWVARRDEKHITLPIYLLCNPMKKKMRYEEWVLWIQKAAVFCEKNTINVVVIDTLTTFSSVQDENDSVQVNMALLPLNYFREKNIAVLLVHHFRKSGGSEGTASRGSGALMAYVDIIMEFSRLEPDDAQGTQRKLVSLSRFDETPGEVILDYVDGKYASQVATSSREAKRQNKAKNVLELIQLLQEKKEIQKTFTIPKIHDHWDETVSKRPSERTLRNYIDELVRMEKLIFTNRERKGAKDGVRTFQVKDGKIIKSPYNFSDLPSTDKNVCSLCQSTDFWQRHDGEWICNRCHPKP